MLLKTLFDNLITHKDKTAFVIEEVSYTYGDLADKIAAIQEELQHIGLQKNDIVLVHTHDDLATYASIIAVWFLGGTFVPINPKHPKERNELIYNQMDVTCVLSSTLAIIDSSDTFINTSKLVATKKQVTLAATDIEHLLYILFTSGTTGVPKGVPISLGNLEVFIIESRKEFAKINVKSRFLQLFELTFDASIHNYILALYVGASVYTVSPNKIKYLEAYKLIQNHQITFVKLSNTVINYLQPFLDKIHLPHVQYFTFGGGEGLQFDLLKKWQKCVPNASMRNVYGPTEATIHSHVFLISRDLKETKTYNGIVSIGKPFGSNSAIIIDEKNQEVAANTIGELCLSGEQVTSGYWKDKAKNKTSFFKKTTNNIVKTYYKTGDLAYIDADGDYLFCGRIDNQVKIQGYRIELTEIEYSAKQFGKASNYIAISRKNKQKIAEIILFSEQMKVDPIQLENYLKEKLPSYMLPSQIINIAVFPKNTNGKIDKLALITAITEH